MPNTFLPVGLSLKAFPCLVVGGGKVALRKIEILLEYDTKLTVIAPAVEEKIAYYHESGRLELIKREYVPPEAQKYGFVISASDDKEINEAVYRDCTAAKVPVNVVDNPSKCDIIFPAVVKRDCLTVAVSTDGKAPFLSRHLRLILEGIFPERWNKLAKLSARFRAQVQEQWRGKPEKKAEAFNRFLAADWQTLLKEKNEQQIEQELERLLLGTSDTDGK